MPRSSGSYSLPSGNPIAYGSKSQSALYNAALSDIASALNAVLWNDGTNAMTGPLFGTSATFSGLGTFGGGVTLSGGQFTGSGAGLTSIPSTALASSSITVTAGSGLSGGGSVLLGGSVTISLPQNVVIPTPSAGVALNVSGFAGSDIAQFVEGSSPDGFYVGYNSTNVSSRMLLGGESTGNGMAFEYQRSVGAFNIGAYSGSSISAGTITPVISWNATRNVSVAAPSSGATLTVNGYQQINDPSSPLLEFQIAGANKGGMYVSGTSNYVLGRAGQDVRIQSGGVTDRVIISSSGNVTINAPSSGQALTLNGLGGASTLLVGGGNSGPTGGTSTFAVRANGSYGGGFAIEDTGVSYWGLYSTAGVLNFGVNTSSTTGSLTSKLSITSAGNVTISPSSGTALAMPTPATVTTVNSASFTTSSASSAGTVGFNSTSASSGSGISNSSGTITLANAGWYLVSFSGTTANSGTNQQINVYLAPSGCTVIGPVSGAPVSVYTAASNGANYGYVGFTALVHSTASNQTFTVQTSVQGINTNPVLTVVQIG